MKLRSDLAWPAHYLSYCVLGCNHPTQTIGSGLVIQDLLEISAGHYIIVSI